MKIRSDCGDSDCGDGPSIGKVRPLVTLPWLPWLALVNVARGISVISGFAEAIPVKDETYQYSLMITVDCFLVDIIKAFKEVRRILTKEGIFIIAFIDRETPLGMLYEQHKHSDNLYRNAKFNSSQEIIELLKLTGFRVLDKKQTIYTLENKTQEVKDGVGEGVFAVIKAMKC